MSVKPWREVAHPHKDVLEGTFKQSEFAADISQVHSGIASPEYQDPVKFFSRTFITEGMRLLLISVAERLSGRGGDPVIQLQTAFGGGKTHTLLAVYHLASRTCPTGQLEGIPPILDAAGIESLPSARVAVIDGIKLSPSQTRSHEGLTINTLWGELAVQLLGADGYAMVADADRDGTSPGKEVLIELLKKAAPCVVLLDELVAYIRQFDSGRAYAGGTYDSNMTFIQALTEALKAVPNAILLASLPESEAESGGAQGQRALEALEKFFGRVESVWKPVATEEAFEIVRRRLFDDTGNTNAIKAVAHSYGELYRSHPNKFPAEAQEAHYEERIAQSYPIHPEVFDRLYEDWSTLDKFQRTRGVLQYMAIVIHRLWNDGDKDPLIMPASLPLHDATVRNKSIHYLPTGWEPVIEGEIDGPRSGAYDIDSRDPRFGSIQAARRVARAVFLGSAPSNAAQAVRGIRAERILLGCVQPGQVVGTYEDVIKRLRDRLHYLYGEQDSYWFDTRPNLRREMESRKAHLSEQDDVLPAIKAHIGRAFGKNHSFAGVHVFTPSADIPDEYGQGPRLAILPPPAGYRRQDSSPATSAAGEILEKRGEAPRLKRNRLIFLAPDADAVPRLKDQVRTHLAWRSIVDDVENTRMDLGTYQVEQAKRAMAMAEQGITQLVRETYRWLMCPFEEQSRGRPVLRWEAVSVSPSAPNLMQEVESKLKEEEWVIYEWSPIHLRNLLAQWYFKDGAKDVSALKVWQDTCHYLYLPRLVNDQVFRGAIAAGVESEDFFGYASGKDGDRYLGLHFGDGGLLALDESSVLIERESAAAYRKLTKAVSQAPTLEPGGATTGTPTQGPESQPQPGTATTGQPAPGQGGLKRHFYGSITLDPVQAKLDFAKVVDEVVQHFTSKLSVDVSISVEIQAKSKDGFDAGLQRTIKENCTVLKFDSAEFEED